MLAWSMNETELADGTCPPTADPQSVVLSGVFRHRRQPAHAPPTMVGVVYGRHRHGGKLAAVRVVSLRASRERALVIAGDYNVTPSESFQLPGGPASRPGRHGIRCAGWW